MNSQAPLTALSQPGVAALVVAASGTAAERNNLDDLASGPESDHLRSTSTEDSSDPSQHSAAPESTTPVNKLQLSTYVVPTTVSTVVAHSAAFTKFKPHGNANSGTKNEGEGEVEDDKKREREHKKRSKNWTRLETLTLIRARTVFDERFRKSGRKMALWDEIAQSLQRANFSRDGQQCKDKWEKLTAGYKEVRDGTRDKEDHPFYDELHQLLSWKSHRRESASLVNAVEANRVKDELHSGHVPSRKEAEAPGCAANGNGPVELTEIQSEETCSPKKRKRALDYICLTDLAVVQDLLETIIARQQRFFKDLLDAVERKERIWEQIRHEREEKWRAEERAQKYAFNNAMIVLTQRLLGEKPGVGTAAATETSPVPVPEPAPAPMGAPSDGLLGVKKRSKNWKRTEVLQLIRFRKEMDMKFSTSTRRAALWEELAEKLASLGVKREGKQCREKWDKLMAEYKDVSDGRKDHDESPYFAELAALLGRKEEGEANLPQGTTKVEYVDS